MLTGRELEPGMGGPGRPPLLTPVGASRPLPCLHTPLPIVEEMCLPSGCGQEASRGPLEASKVSACLTLHSSLTVFFPESLPCLLVGCFLPSSVAERACGGSFPWGVTVQHL